MITITLAYSLIMFYGRSPNFIFVTPSLLWTLSFIFLADSLRRIKKVMKSLTDVVIIYEAFFLYAATAALAIFG